MGKMNMRPYGKTGYEVSAFGVGCMRLPKIYKDGRTTVDLEKAFEIIRYAAENGVNYFDTAFGYHHKTSESVLGEALDGGLRKQVKIATKQPLAVMKTQADIRRNLEDTLKKLRTDYIDVYLIHNINASSWDEIRKRDIYGEYEKLRSEGMIKAIGFSYHGKIDPFREVLAEYPWDMCQVQQNLLDVDKEVTAEAISLAGKKGCALVIMEPLRGGGLAEAPTRIKELYDAFPVKRSPAEWAFRHLLDYPQVSTILSGVSTLEQLKENIEIFSQLDAVPGCVSADERLLLDKVKSTYDSIVSIPCTGCEYCMPCPSGVNIANTFSLYNNGMRFENFNQPRRSHLFASQAGGGADRCVECGMCEPKCPQNIAIIRELKTAHKTLEGWIE